MSENRLNGLAEITVEELRAKVNESGCGRDLSDSDLEQIILEEVELRHNRDDYIHTLYDHLRKHSTALSQLQQDHSALASKPPPMPPAPKPVDLGPVVKAILGPLVAAILNAAKLAAERPPPKIVVHVHMPRVKRVIQDVVRDQAGDIVTTESHYEYEKDPG